MSVTSYNVTAGEDFATIATLDGETKVTFSFTPNLIAVKATGDDASITVARFAGAQSGDDGVRTIASGESTTLEPYNGDKFVYVNGTGGVEVWAGRAGEEIPPSFKKSAKGGESGGGTHYRGTTTTAISDGSTTNPITINGEEYTAVFGDIVVYSSSEFIFDGTAWSEIGRGVDTTPTSGSANFVTSNGIYQRTPLVRGTGNHSAYGGGGTSVQASGNYSIGYGYNIFNNQSSMAAFGQNNYPHNGDLFNVGNGSNSSNRSNILEANSTSVNINGDIRQNGVPLRATTMPTITASMLGKVVQYVGTSDSNYNQGWNYVAVSDGAAEPTYSWRALMDSTPTSNSNNPVTSHAVYWRTPMSRYSTNNSAIGGLNSQAPGNNAFAYGSNCKASGNYSIAFNSYTTANGAYATAMGQVTNANQDAMTAIGKYNSPRIGDLFNIGNGTANNAKSNIVEVNATSANVNGDIQRNGVGIDDYTTTERKIGKWIDGSDLYQRTFEVTGLVNGQWNENVLGTSGINIVDVQGWIDWTYNSEPNGRTNLNYYSNPKDFVGLQIEYNDLIIKPNRTGDTGMLITEAVITIKYTKPVANLLSNNIQTANEPNEEPTEGEDMRSEPVEEISR